MCAITPPGKSGPINPAGGRIFPATGWRGVSAGLALNDTNGFTAGTTDGSVGGDGGRGGEGGGGGEGGEGGAGRDTGLTGTAGMGLKCWTGLTGGRCWEGGGPPAGARGKF